MGQILKIARREFISGIKSKTFIISVVFAPLMIGAMLFFTQKMAGSRPAPAAALRVVLLDRSNQLSGRVLQIVKKQGDFNEPRKIALTVLPAGNNDFKSQIAAEKENLRKGAFDAFFVIDPNIIDPNGEINIFTCNLKPSNIDSLGFAEGLVTQAVREARFEKNKIDPSFYSKLESVKSSQIDVGSAEGAERSADMFTKMMVPFFFMYLIFLSFFINGQQMLTSVIEEKSSRIMELLVSIVNPFELMAGKILGLTGIGFTVVAIWAGGSISAAEYRGLNIDLSWQLIVYFIIFYILGYLLFSSIMAGIGSICNTLRDAQNLMFPVTLLFIVPLLSWLNLVREPSSLYARVLSYIPPLTPMVMMLRLTASGDVSLVEIIISMIVLFFSVIAAIWISAKIFRTGILMYGKRPGLFEIIRWFRQA
jgi:ABC-2 type transport system permease protein